MLWRRLLRIALATPLRSVGWWLLAVTAPAPVGPDPTPLPLAAPSVELSAMATTALAVSAIATRFVPDGLAGTAAAPIVMVGVGVLFALPDRLTLFASNQLDQRWASTHRTWWLVLASTVVALVLAGADRGRPGPLTRLRAASVRTPGPPRSP